MPKNSYQLSKAFGYLHTPEVASMKAVISCLPKNSVCINIGAGVGTSGLIFMESDKVGKLYTIDICKEARAIGGLGNERIAMKEAGFENDPRHEQICGDSTNVGLTWAKGSVDMVFIDGDHSYEHCKSDAEAWIPHIKPDGIVSFHDYAQNPWIGVWRYVNELLFQTETYQLIANADTFIALRVLG